MTTSCSIIHPLHPDAGKMSSPDNVKIALHSVQLEAPLGHKPLLTLHAKLGYNE